GLPRSRHGDPRERKGLRCPKVFASLSADGDVRAPSIAIRARAKDYRCPNVFASLSADEDVRAPSMAIRARAKDYAVLRCSLRSVRTGTSALPAWRSVREQRITLS